MNARRFDAFSRSLIEAASRRRVLYAFGSSVITRLASVDDEAAAGCRKVGSPCGKQTACCAGSRCQNGTCRCKPGWKDCNAEGLCRKLSTNPDHCGSCNQSCASSCCVGGQCHDLCKGACCAGCFAEADGVAGPPHPGTEFCCDGASVCNSGTANLADDLCCWPDEECLNGSCCCDGCRGTKACGGACCPRASCCNGTCCPQGQVCARPNPKKPPKCVSANRSCTSDNQCYGDEECWGGVCCAGDRRCFALGPGTDPVCCPVGKYCDQGNSQCCANGKSCSTSKKVRIRP